MFFPSAARSAALAAALIAAPALAHDPASHAHSAPVSGEPVTPFIAENNAAMDKMMAAMAVKPTGDVERDFVEMMIPHHQGALDMAQAYLRHGKDERLKRIAQEIIVGQLQEIAAMRLAVGDPLPASAPAPTQSQTPQAAPPKSLPAAHHKH